MSVTASLLTADWLYVTSPQPDCNAHPTLTLVSHQMKWTTQEPAVLQGYRRAYRLDTPSTFKNPLSHIVLSQGVGRMSPTMLRAKSKRRVHKDQLAMAVRKNFNALGVNESDVIVDWLYKTKNQGAHTASMSAPCNNH
jgi:histone deacetylase complex subunit SAP30